MLTNQEVAEELVKKFENNVFDFEEPYGLLTLSIDREQVTPALEYLKNHDKFQINFLTDIAGVHYPDSPGREFCVVYHAHSFVNNFRIRLKVFVPENDIHVPTASFLYESANWMERETYDFFGIIFDGHPKLQRILNMDEMDYFPLRKEYPLEDGTRNDKIDALFGR
ncbi:MAG: NADH-quinone oxidoreductase subunit C [Runella slithyformis]|nr:MAG: NADH-quinone oxidoreductase subunit C [Runella slithyformis]TAE93347.1 MAG: NADH-quinone oxidoreductase subunit C [Runella slithyformis]TAF29689.1 MAG: NADH-quinone oxidoreductase subunit C [Runella slithyformis]TAF48508.1 MAG: NADH-quinone oxidoreductase subunit C [Runella slithyformis]TAF83306.1 MAG: NADH-quinone oxidoreductase subunit C [Runella slithyformis]